MKETLNSLLIKKILPPQTKHYRPKRLQETIGEKTLPVNLFILSITKKYLFFFFLLFVSFFFYFFPVFDTKKPLQKDFSDTNLLKSIANNKTTMTNLNTDNSIQSIPFTIDQSKQEDSYRLLDAPNIRISLKNIGDRENLNGETNATFVNQTKQTYSLEKYLVKRGDTLWSIANEANINVDSLISVNLLNPENPLQEGKELKIPSIDGLFIKVEAFDTLAKLSEKYALNEKIIENDNPGINKEPLHIGQTLFLRGARYDAKKRKQLFGSLFNMPLSNAMLLSDYGFHYKAELHETFFHPGIDLLAITDLAVLACTDGKVKFVGNMGVWGNTVVIHSQNGYDIYYSHLNSIDVKADQIIKQGETLGMLGGSEELKKNYLHLEIRKEGKIINPNRFLSLNQ